MGHFLLHYLEMCMACCVGEVTLGFAFFGGAAPIGYPDLIGQAPFFSTLVLATRWRWGLRRWGWVSS